MEIRMKGINKLISILILLAVSIFFILGCGKREVHEKIWIDTSEELAIAESSNSNEIESKEKAVPEVIRKDGISSDSSISADSESSQLSEPISESDSLTPQTNSTVSSTNNTAELESATSELKEAEGPESLSEQQSTESNTIESERVQQKPIESVAEESESISEQTIESASEESEKVQEQNIFAMLPVRSFGHSSGHGAWGSEIEIAEDGSFIGKYHDTNMGESGEGYPHGTVRQCNFYGKFKNSSQIDAYTYTCELDYLSTEMPVGAEEIVDLVRYLYTDAYGIAGGSNFLFFLPGKPISELSDGMLNWYRNTTGERCDPSEAITRYCIYNVEGGYLFLSARTE